jgi:hypothetical protein
VEKVDEILAVGEAVFVKVISLDDGKVALAMKYVSQGDGRDLDKNQVQLEMDRQRHAKRGPGEARPIHVENMESILCRRCGGRGHLASNCFHLAGSSAAPYDPEDDDRALRAAEAAADAARASINAAADQKSAAKAARRAEKDEAKRLKKRRRLEADVKSLSSSHVTSVEDARRLLEEESERKRAKKEKKRAKKEQKKQEKKEKKERRKAAKKASKSSSHSSSRRSDDDSSSSSSSSDSDESDS